MPKRGVYNKLQITEEEYQEIKKENRRKLEEILTTPDYMEMLGKKYYGERWHSVMPSGHYKKVEHKKLVQKYGATTPKYMDRAILQCDMNGNLVKEWQSSRIFVDEHKEEFKNPYSAAHHITKVALGKGETAYGFKWKFKEE